MGMAVRVLLACLFVLRHPCWVGQGCKIEEHLDIEKYS